MTRRGGPGSAGRSGSADAEDSPEVPVGTGSIRWRSGRAAGGADGLVPASRLSAHACAFESKGDRDAIADYTKAIETRPLSAGAYFRRGIVYRTKGQQRSRHREL
jgi:hypothetical protein